MKKHVSNQILLSTWSCDWIWKILYCFQNLPMISQNFKNFLKINHEEFVLNSLCGVSWHTPLQFPVVSSSLPHTSGDYSSTDKHLISDNNWSKEPLHRKEYITRQPISLLLVKFGRRMWTISDRQKHVFGSKLITASEWLFTSWDMSSKLIDNCLQYKLIVFY